MNIIAFVNRGSGGNDGGRVLAVLTQLLGADRVFDIKADGGPERGLDAAAADDTVETRVIVAGGDGTFSWVANTVERRKMRHVRLVVFPLGSGNDMARALGWGKKFPGLARIPRYVEWMRGATPHVLDVWRLSAVEDMKWAAMESAATIDGDGIVHGARPLMCNYLSLGADAFVELRFNQMRWENPQRFKSRIGNMKAHFVVGTRYICSRPSKKIHISEHVESLIIDGEHVPIPNNLQALIFLNIPSYGAGTQPWGFPRNHRTKSNLTATHIENLPPRNDTIHDMFVDDRRFEVIGLRNLQQFGLIRTIGTHGIRIAHGSRAAIKLKSEATPFQVDGEPWEQRGGEVLLEAGNPVGVLEGPVFKEKSRKNAKFNLGVGGPTNSLYTNTGDSPSQSLPNLASLGIVENGPTE